VVGDEGFARHLPKARACLSSAMRGSMPNRRASYDHTGCAGATLLLAFQRVIVTVVSI
jgi:hypothetical protein